jgi:predicted DNA-binding transcriptional regulator AlpA
MAVIEKSELLTIRNVAQILGYRSTSTIYDQIKNGTFPLKLYRRPIGNQSVKVVKRSELDEWLNSLERLN